jgi:uncharacterized protein YkuJ
MDIGIISSGYKIFGRVTIEYILNKLAVITSNLGVNIMLVNWLKDIIVKIIKRNDIENKKNIKRLFLEEKNLENNGKGITDVKYFDEEVIVSLTTYSIRVNTVHLVIESLFQQIIKANRIILWLDENEFKEIKDLPFALTRMQERGLEIKFYKNIKSYKKLIPTLKEYPNQIIITVDDDIMYPVDFIEKLLNNYKKNSRRIYYYRGYSIQYTKEKILPYRNWINKESNNLLLNFPTGVGGVLYPPNCFHSDVLNEEKFMNLCPKGDDIWFKVMSLLNNIECKKVYTDNFGERFLPIDSTQKIALWIANVQNGENDIQIENVFKEYKIIDKLNSISEKEK